MKRLLATAALTGVLAAGWGLSAVKVEAWGASGHRLVAVAAMQALPDDLPAFLKSPGAVADVAEFAREPDRWKGAGRAHDRERDTGHFIDLTDEGRAMTDAGPALAELPTLRSEYEAVLTRAGIDVDDAGWLPYAIVDASQQLERDFSYWRVLTAAARRETDPAKKAWYLDDLRRREALLLRDIGVLAHYVGDGSQPLHTSIHYNGWGEYPNPEGFTNSRQTHGLFEGQLTRRASDLQAVREAMSAAAPCGCPVDQRTKAYLARTVALTLPLYRLEKAGAFAAGADAAGNVPVDPRARAFIVERLGAGASELRDLIVDAWGQSGRARVGWPAVAVVDVEAGTVDPWLSMISED
ncbi:MAG TPA: S1/P1 Nuclease [Caulobacteraceae bacterium]|jgi:hypothetical protein